MPLPQSPKVTVTLAISYDHIHGRHSLGPLSGPPPAGGSRRSAKTVTPTRWPLIRCAVIDHACAPDHGRSGSRAARIPVAARSAIASCSGRDRMPHTWRALPARMQHAGVVATSALPVGITGDRVDLRIRATPLEHGTLRNSTFGERVIVGDEMVWSSATDQKVGSSNLFGRTALTR